MVVKLLICGAGGMLGRDLVLAAEAEGHEVVTADRRVLDVTDAGRRVLDVTDADAVSRAVESEGPGAVVNCAAFTDVDGAESDPVGAMRVNADGARHVAAAAAALGACVVYPSSDYVFDGAKGRPYVESDDPDPLSSYGRSKLAGELATAKANPRHHVVRTSWLFGTGGRNFVETMLELGAGRPEVTVVCDQLGSPTYTVHLARAIVRLLQGEGYGTRHMAAGGGCSWYDFAVAIFERAGLDCCVRPITTAEFGRPAPRPAYSVLESERGDTPGLPPWQTGLDEYLAER